MGRPRKNKKVETVTTQTSESTITVGNENEISVLRLENESLKEQNTDLKKQLAELDIKYKNIRKRLRENEDGL